MLGISLRSNSSVKRAWSHLEYLALCSIAFQNYDLFNQYLLDSCSVPGIISVLRIQGQTIVRVLALIMGLRPSEEKDSQ